jgi:hypothetical protein
MLRSFVLTLAASWLIASTVHADETALRARLEALGTIAETEADLAEAARTAIDRSVSDRARGDEAARARAERIAEASLALIERRRARIDAAERLHAAELEREAVRRRLADARTAAASDARERERLDPAVTP